MSKHWIELDSDIIASSLSGKGASVKVVIDAEAIDAIEPVLLRSNDCVAAIWLKSGARLQTSHRFADAVRQVRAAQQQEPDANA